MRPSCAARTAAAAKEGAPSCEFCGAEFTLHQRDLDTICPHCLTHSATCQALPFLWNGIHPEMLAGEPSGQPVCPACGAGHLLVSRAWGEVSAMECGSAPAFGYQ